MRAKTPEDEAERLQALYEYDILDSDAELSFDDLALLAAAICRTPMAAISLVDDDRQWFKAAVGLAARETSRDAAFCAHAILDKNELMVVENAVQDARFADNPLVTGQPGIRFYAGAPLVTEAGDALGTMCVIDTEPRQLDQAQRLALKALGRQVMALIESRRANRQLVVNSRATAAALRHTRSLNRVTSALLDRSELDALQQTVVDLIADTLPADRVVMFTFDLDRQTIMHFKRGGPGSERVVQVSFAELSAGLTGWVLHNKLPALSPQADPDPRESPEVQRRRAETRCGDIIVVPIVHDDRVAGTITAINAAEAPAFGDAEVDLMMTMANQIAIAMQTRRLFSDLKSATERVTLAKNAAGMGVWEWDMVRDLVRWDEQMYQLYGRVRSHDLEPFSVWSAAVHPDDRGRLAEETRQALDGRRDFDSEFRIVRPDGEIRHLKATAQVQSDPAGHPARMIGVSFDITRRKLAEIQLAKTARCDKLTGLANRVPFMERLETAIRRVAAGEQRCYGVLFLDFDRFKHVNDTLGHDAGDELLKAISERLKSTLRSSDMLLNDNAGTVVSRFGGDEFLVLIDDAGSTGDIPRVAERLLNALAPPYLIQGTEVHSSASIGVVTSDQGSVRAEEVIRNADLAMYEAKRAGRGRCTVFNESMHARLTRHVTIEAGLRKAIGTAELYLVYQPIVDLETGEMVSAEALVRWEHPVMGTIHPEEFIPIAEESGLIIALDRWVQREACETLAEWRRADPRRAPKTISVNVSRAELAQGNRLLDQVRDTLAAAGLPPRCLQLEVTEREVMHQPEAAKELLRGLRDIGVKIAMDDFGTGTSSLGFLRNYRFDCIKIDQSFMQDLSASSDALAVIHATIHLIENLNMTSVAEGVEDAAQVAILQSMGCRLAQGFYFSAPVPKHQLLNFSMHASAPLVACAGQ